MLLYFKKLSSNVCRKTSEDHFLKGHTKKRSAKVAQKLFWEVWKNLGKNPLHPQKFACSCTYGVGHETQLTNASQLCSKTRTF